ncbi:hypothetical protein [Falsiroseomonas ponticola]|uniref:hypothetical protein n=1 Tax=Falsiroseomonas ponticola TaxID=2786951 RepID=UPI001931C992|nr:hypothetical protein [Roseomonas ponticola]
MEKPRLSDRHVWRQVLLTDLAAGGTDMRARMHQIMNDRKQRAQADQAIAQLQDAFVAAYREDAVLRTDSVIEDYLNLSIIFTDLLTEAIDVSELDIEGSTTPLPAEITGGKRRDLGVERARVMILAMFQDEPALTAAACQAWQQEMKGEESDWLALSQRWFTACQRLDGPKEDLDYKQVTHRFTDFLRFLTRTEQALPPPLQRLFG